MSILETILCLIIAGAFITWLVIEILKTKGIIKKKKKKEEEAEESED